MSKAEGGGAEGDFRAKRAANALEDVVNFAADTSKVAALGVGDGGPFREVTVDGILDFAGLVS